MTDAATDAAPAAGPDDPALIGGALRSRGDDATAWTVAWGMLPPGVETVQVTFREGRRTEPAARVGVLGRHWAAEVAGCFGKVQVTAGAVREGAKVRTREKTPTPGRFSRKRSATTPSDPLERMKHHWGLAAVILQPESEDRPMLPDIRSAGRDMA